jgi:RimJ/RimL family protein N-acetyltransferase
MFVRVDIIQPNLTCAAFQIRVSWLENRRGIMKIQPVTLTGKFIRLEPLSENHVPDLAQVGIDENIWQFMLYGEIRTEADMHGWVRDILSRQKRGTDLPFTVIQQGSGKAIGCTRYLEIHPEHRNLEIGGTWYGAPYRGTWVNTEAKYLLLRHAFEILGCIRVQLKTDLRNVRSQRAIERIGAQKEGILRDHMILLDGTIRSSVYYSILEYEWPDVKRMLEQRLTGQVG